MLSFTLSGKHMSYAYKHYSKQITVIDIRIFMNSYNKLIHILILITDLCLFRFPVGVTKLILILILLADL